MDLLISLTYQNITVKPLSHSWAPYKMSFKKFRAIFQVTITLLYIDDNSFAQKTEEILKFIAQLLCIYNNEACDVADINQDNLVDIVAGRLWYAASDFNPPSSFHWIAFIGLCEKQC